jgi:hypothetical protein
LDVLEWACKLGCPCYIKEACIAAAKSGSLAVLQQVRQRGYPWDKDVTSKAARGGHLELLRWARQQGCPMDKRACMAVAESHCQDVVVAWLCSLPA